MHRLSIRARGTLCAQRLSTLPPQRPPQPAPPPKHCPSIGVVAARRPSHQLRTISRTPGRLTNPLPSATGNLGVFPDPIDGIEYEMGNEYLRPDASWGFAVYRTCYDDEAAWQKMRGLIETTVREGFEDRGRGDILARHRTIFMDDRAQLENARPAEVRDHFERWAREELERNWAAQPVTDELREEMHGSRDGTSHGLGYFIGARYNVCVVIDDACLQSLDESWPGFSPVVMLVKKGWDTDDEAESEEVHPDFEDGWMVDKNEGPNGFVYVPVCEYVEQYNALCECDEWIDDHRFMYPSAVYESMGLDKSPGFWSKANKRV